MANEMLELDSADGRKPKAAFGAVGAVAGVVAFIATVWALQPLQFHVVNYTAQRVESPRYPLTVMYLVGLCLLTVVPALWAAWSGLRLLCWSTLGRCLWPLVLTVPVACYAFVDVVPPFYLVLLMVLGLTWTGYRSGLRWPVRAAGGTPLSPPLLRGEASGDAGSLHAAAVTSLVVFIIVLTYVHTRLQINFFEHFALGHADFGHFTEELKNVLAGRGLRSDSFDNTRLGWHFVPMLYLLVPGYWLWPSPYYLMVCSALLVHIAALPAYYLARRLSGSVAVGWLIGCAWLLLPSQSRLVYSHTYGFQWIYFAIPLIALMISTGLTGRWRTCLVFVVLILLCKETAAAATLGWGVYLALFTARRKLGISIAVVSLVYVVLCVSVFIPHFAATDSYQRVDQFGDLGSSFAAVALSPFRSPGLLFGRLVRPQAIYFLLILLAPMALTPLRGWRVSLAAVPTLLLILLLRNSDWLSIKFWHQATVLPFLFFAGIATLGDGQLASSTPRVVDWLRGGRIKDGRAIARGVALAMFVGAGWGHYLFGFSPLSKSYDLYAAHAPFHAPDPRLATVTRLREEIPRNKSLHATERLAAHFVDYAHIYTKADMKGADYVIIDRSDRWDASGLPQKARELAGDPAYWLQLQEGPIVVFRRVVAGVSEGE